MIESGKWRRQMWGLRIGVKDFVRSLFWAVFEKPGQWATIFLGSVLIVFGAVAVFFSGSSSWAAFFSAALGAALSGIGCSVVASGLVVKILQSATLGRNVKALAETGVLFVGNQDSFFLNHGRKGRSGWDHWIEETPPRGQILICGKKNGNWIKKSSKELQEAIGKDVTIEFIFLGTEQQIAENVNEFKTDAYNNRLDHLEGKLFRYIVNPENPIGDDCGFYWNGKRLMVKVYLPGVKNEVSPIIGFDTSFAGRKFNKEDFHHNYVPFHQGDALMECALALHEICSNKKPLD